MSRPTTSYQLPTTQQLRVAIVHDWFVGGGAEQVVEQLHKLYPDAPIYTAYCSPQWRKRLAGAQIITSYMQYWPLPKLRKFLPPLRAMWFSHLNLSGYDLVISSSGAEAKGVKVKAPAVHINYCHAPTHYYWSRYDDYLKSPGFGFFDPLARLGLKLLVGPMRKWDYKAAQRPHHIIANSSYIKGQVKQYYGRDAEVINPPVDIERFTESSDKKAKPTQATTAQGASEDRKGDVQDSTLTSDRNLQQSDVAASAGGTAGSAGGQAGAVRRFGFLAVGRQTYYKRIDLAVAACTKLNLPLTVIGNGPEHKKLRKNAGRSVTFLKGLTDEELVKHFQAVQAFIFPGVDDFGIVAVEALAAGTPVIAYKDGGALDYIRPGQNGIFFDTQDIDALIKVLSSFKPAQFDSGKVRQSALSFSPQEFQRKFKALVDKLVQR